MNHPYTPPEANFDVNENQFETYEPKFLSIQGRIGRLRYIAYNTAITFLIMIVFGVFAGIAVATMAGGMQGGGVFFGILGVLGFIVYIVMIGISFIYAKRRLNDLNQSGWLSLLSLVPVVNFFLWLYLLLAPGSATSNQYGPPPSKNPTWIVVVTILIPVFIILMGIVAAIAIPAYQDYVNKAKAGNEAAKARAAEAPAIPDSLPSAEPQSGGGEASSGDQPAPSGEGGGEAEPSPTPQPSNN